MSKATRLQNLSAPKASGLLSESQLVRPNVSSSFDDISAKARVLGVSNGFLMLASVIFEEPHDKEYVLTLDPRTCFIQQLEAISFEDAANPETHEILNFVTLIELLTTSVFVSDKHSSIMSVVQRMNARERDALTTACSDLAKAHGQDQLVDSSLAKRPIVGRSAAEIAAGSDAQSCLTNIMEIYESILLELLNPQPDQSEPEVAICIDLLGSREKCEAQERNIKRHYTGLVPKIYDAVAAVPVDSFIYLTMNEQCEEFSEENDRLTAQSPGLVEWVREDVGAVPAAMYYKKGSSTTAIGLSKEVVTTNRPKYLQQLYPELILFNENLMIKFENEAIEEEEDEEEAFSLDEPTVEVQASGRKPSAPSQVSTIYPNLETRKLETVPEDENEAKKKLVQHPSPGFGVCGELPIPYNSYSVSMQYAIDNLDPQMRENVRNCFDLMYAGVPERKLAGRVTDFASVEINRYRTKLAMKRFTPMKQRIVDGVPPGQFVSLVHDIVVSEIRAKPHVQLALTAVYTQQLYSGVKVMWEDDKNGQARQIVRPV